MPAIWDLHVIVHVYRDGPGYDLCNSRFNLGRAELIETEQHCAASSGQWFQEFPP